MLSSSIGDGLLRPFVLVYAVLVQGLSLPAAGLALSLVIVAGLVTLPFAGRWLDAGAPTNSCYDRADHPGTRPGNDDVHPRELGLWSRRILLGIGSQPFLPAHAAVVSNLVSGRDRDAALAASRALRNAGMGDGST